jgi:hypothetical protein
MEMAQAIWNGAVLAESDDIVVVDGYTYFPREAVREELLVETATETRCGWKARRATTRFGSTGGRTETPRSTTRTPQQPPVTSKAGSPSGGEWR